MSDDYKENIKQHSTWMRGLNIVLFTIIYSVTEIVIALVVVFQFLSVLLTREANVKLLDLGKNLSVYVYQILSYVTFNTDERPFPFADFPVDGVMQVKTSSKPVRKKASKKKAAKKQLADESSEAGSSEESTDDNKG